MIDGKHRPTHTVSIHIGGIHASREPAVVRTVLGSCIAVCLRDPIARIGGMNHFLLPHGGDHELASARYGIHAMELLINGCMKAGADRASLEAKVFGGGRVLRMASEATDVANSNIRFAFEFLETECIPVVKRDVGGTCPREVYFYSDTGRVLVRHLRSAEMVAADLSTIVREESQAVKRLRTATQSDDSNVTLF
jgi:chemotaxis receptor (MCP) glutamine deamidase CheD